jgi:hypothetical protein
MLQCRECEYFSQDSHGGIMLRCDPFGTIKEPECLQKWQLIRLDGLFRSYQAVLGWYSRMTPMQEKMMKFMEREMGDIDEAERWKYGQDGNEDMGAGGNPDEPEDDRQ